MQVIKMLNVGMYIKTILHRKGPLTANQIYDIFVRETGLRDRRENFDMFLQGLVDKYQVLKLRDTYY